MYITYHLSFWFYIKYKRINHKGGKTLEKILEVKNISKKYQSKENEILALEDVNFSVSKGEFISIIGPSGCGKSTLLSIIAGLETKSGGEIYIEDEKVNTISSKVGYMLQRDCLLEWRTIFSNARFGLEIKGNQKKEDKELIFLTPCVIYNSPDIKLLVIGP